MIACAFRFVFRMMMPTRITVILMLKVELFGFEDRSADNKSRGGGDIRNLTVLVFNGAGTNDIKLEKKATVEEEGTDEALQTKLTPGNKTVLVLANAKKMKLLPLMKKRLLIRMFLMLQLSLNCIQKLMVIFQ